jgi:uncharacterized membrane protein YobD (UPF0266 family)
MYLGELKDCYLVKTIRHGDCYFVLVGVLIIIIIRLRNGMLLISKSTAVLTSNLNVMLGYLFFVRSHVCAAFAL